MTLTNLSGKDRSAFTNVKIKIWAVDLDSVDHP